MNFHNFYKKTQSRLTDSILSLWATGDSEMQKYFSFILEKEGLLAEPVFQTAFPWEPSKLNFGETTSIFDGAFINALDNIKSPEYRFPKERVPYKHQIESWDTLINGKKSIAVTTGTGSGKTECFMLPVLYDIFKNCQGSTGVNAIFLYPLNALIGSQKKRVDAWCRGLSGVTYSVYNGNTVETVKADDERNKLPELISRKQIRETPPQILFTNPSMLEYILVRNKDVSLLKNSEGKLRWILLDEAHTLTGSSAAEMALLIRRVVDAFKVDVKQVRFAITSATVGAGPDSHGKLKEFMGTLCGINTDQIVVVSGKRVLSQTLEKSKDAVRKPADLLQSQRPENYSEVQTLRKDLLNNNALSIRNIGARFSSDSLEDSLKIVDTLAERKVDGHSILPVRGHFFSRGIGGVFVCTNKDCTEHKDARPNSAIGTMTTFAESTCKCGSVMVELVACRSCGNQLLESEKAISNITGNEQIKPAAALSEDAFAIDSEDDDEEKEGFNVSKFYFTRRFVNKIYSDSLYEFSITKNGEIFKPDAKDFVAHSDGRCPHCGDPVVNPLHFRLSSPFVNRILADILLEETPEAENQTKDILWKGHKYISFTDSRQGTAKISALINQDNEAAWVRSHVYHKLCEQKKEWRERHPAFQREELIQIIEQLERELLTTTFPILKIKKQEELDGFKALLKHPQETPRLSLGWTIVKDYLSNLTEFNKLFDGNNIGDISANGKTRYLTAILFDEFARRLPRKRSIENLGMISLVYPKLEKQKIPSIASSLKISEAEWQSLLKIAIDYFIRYSFGFFVNHELDPYLTSAVRSVPIFSHDSTYPNIKRWPSFDKSRIRQSRLVLLICAGLGFHNGADIDNFQEDQINELLGAIWKSIKSVLSIDGEGFKLSLEENSEFQLSTKLWLCPVKRNLIDAHFRDYSPWIKGSLTNDNIRQYKIKSSVNFPEFPFPFNVDEHKNLALEQTREWLESETNQLRAAGVWNNLHEQIILNRPLYLAGEHSAQQSEKRLKELEWKFENAQINILNCSTTMEMGVDIGGISTVVMNNVPPSPANYLQRAGRAGRRFEAKSVAFTTCAPGPIGLQAISDPMWALSHQIAPPYLSFKSASVVERHINAFFLGKFVQTETVRGLNVTDDVQTMFFKGDDAISALFISWLSDNDVKGFEKNVISLVRNTPMGDNTFEYLLLRSAGAFNGLISRTTEFRISYDKKLESQKNSFGENSPAYKATFLQKEQFLSRNAIGYLANEGFLPSAGLPTGIIEFDTLNIEDLKNKKFNKSKPSYFITRALSEFAPGNIIVIDGKSHKSAGIVLKNDRGEQFNKEIIQSCKTCGFQRIAEVIDEDDISTKCPHCGGLSFQGIKFKNQLQRRSFTEMIQPAGYAVDIYDAPDRKISDARSSQYVDPLLLNIAPWPNTTSSLFDVRESDANAEILFYNVGSGDGYSVCLHCGRAGAPEELAGHKRLRGGKNNDLNSMCSGNDNSYAIRQNVVLGGRFRTDFCELRFKNKHNVYSKDAALVYTLGAVLSQELCIILGIEEREIGFGIKKYDSHSSVFIFDTAKGGAGYSSQFSMHAREILENSKIRLARCNCNKACTRCLIDRTTQWHIENLDRTEALEWLDRALNTTVPPALISQYPGIQPLLGNINHEIGRLNYTRSVKHIWLLGSGNAESWDFNSLPVLNKLHSDVSINIVFDSMSPKLAVQDQITLIQIKAWSQLWKELKPDNDPLKTLCYIETTDGRSFEYLTSDFSDTLNNDWGNTITGANIYKREVEAVEVFEEVIPSIENQTVFEVTIDEKGSINSNGIADLVLNKLKTDLKANMKGQLFAVEYSDRYVRTPLGCIMMLQFVDKLKTRIGFEIDSFTFKGHDFIESRTPYQLSHSFQNATQRGIAIIEFAEQLGIPDAHSLTENIPHYRYFEFRSRNLKVTIRPDAGIEHGWVLSSPGHAPYDKNTTADKVLRIRKKDNNKMLYTISVQTI